MRTFVYGFSALIFVLPASAIFAGRAVLPGSQCAVSAAQITQVKLETSYEQVKAALGCDGVRTVDFEIEDLRSETYSWRGTAWPYSTFTGHFYNGTLHGTDQLVLNFEVNWHTPEPDLVTASVK